MEPKIRQLKAGHRKSSSIFSSKRKRIVYINIGVISQPDIYQEPKYFAHEKRYAGRSSSQIGMAESEESFQ